VCTTKPIIEQQKKRERESTNQDRQDVGFEVLLVVLNAMSGEDEEGRTVDGQSIVP
jgi:hypothetical protein